MFSHNQTETTSTTASTEQDAPLSKNQRRKREREQSPNWLGNPQREYEGTIYRIANQGRKRHDDGVLARMAAKRAERMAKKQPRVEQTTEITTAQKPSVPADIKVVNRYGDTPVVYKKSHGKLIALVFLDGDNPKDATVYNIKDNVASLCNKGSRAQKYTDDEFVKFGWKTGKLDDDGFELILALLMEDTDEQSSNVANAA